jgi:adenylate cyclase
VGEPTWSRLAGLFPGIRIGEVMLRGRHTALGAYRIDSAAAERARAPRAISA